MSKPTVDTSWATSATFANYVIDQDGNTELVLNKAEPSNSYKASGVPATTPVIRGYMNYKLYADHQMIEWLRIGEVGRVLEFADSVGKTTVDIQNDYGGTWVDQGTYTKASLLTRVFVKTA